MPERIAYTCESDGGRRIIARRIDHWAEELKDGKWEPTSSAVRYTVLVTEDDAHSKIMHDLQMNEDHSTC